jgi:HEAT repeat protein
MEDIQALIAALDDRSRRLSARAASRKLLAYGDLAVPPLIDTLNTSKSYSVRSGVAKLLGKLGDHRAVDALMGALSGTYSPTIDAAVALGNLRDQRALQPLIKLMFKYHHNRVSTDEIASAVAAFGYPALSELQPYLNSISGSTRGLVIRAIASMNIPKAVPLLISALDDPDLDVRSIATWGLGLARDERGVQPLIDQIHRLRGYSRSETFSRVIEALGRIGDRQAVDGLRNLIAHPIASVREQAATALGHAQDPRAFDLLNTALSDVFASVRVSALMAMVQVKDSRVVGRLLEMLDDPEEKVSTSAISALATLGEKSILQLLLDALVHDKVFTRARAAYDLGRLGDERAIGALVNALADIESDVRACAAVALGQLKATQAIQVLATQLNDHRLIYTAQRIHSRPTTRHFYTHGVINTPIKSTGVAAEIALEEIGTSEALLAIETWRKSYYSSTED